MLFDKMTNELRGHDITIAFFFRRKLCWMRNPSTLFGIRFVEWVKNLLPTIRKMKKKNKALKYHVPSPKKYDKDNTKLID